MCFLLSCIFICQLHQFLHTHRPLGRIMSLCFLESFWIILGYHPSYLLPGPNFPEASPAGFFPIPHFVIWLVSQYSLEHSGPGFRQHDRGFCIYIDSSHSKDNSNIFKPISTYFILWILFGQDPTMDFHH